MMQHPRSPLSRRSRIKRQVYDPLINMSIVFTTSSSHLRKANKDKHKHSQHCPAPWTWTAEDDTNETHKSNCLHQGVEKVPSIHKKKDTVNIHPYPIEQVSRLASLHDLSLDDFANDDLCHVDEFACDEEFSPEMAETSTSTEEEVVIEVLPGIVKTLRGADYTSRAWKRGECIDAKCFVCDIQLSCAADCGGVVCPKCLSVSPVETNTGSGFVGIGIHVE